jgi:hypothetical protein
MFVLVSFMRVGTSTGCPRQEGQAVGDKHQESDERGTDARKRKAETGLRNDKFKRSIKS